MTTAGRPVGIAGDRERDRAVNTSVKRLAARQVEHDRGDQRERRRSTSCLVSFSSWRVSGDFDSSWSPGACREMWPTSVAMPVAVTTNSPVPRVTLRVHVDHVGAVAERGVRRRDGVDALADRQALAGQRRLGDLERRRAQDAPVGRDDVAGLDRRRRRRARAARPAAARARRRGAPAP